MATLRRLVFVCSALALVASAGGCAHIPSDRYGVSRMQFEGMEEMDARALASCLATHERRPVSLTLGVPGDPDCGMPPFDGNQLRLRLWTWPWTDWPLFEQSVWSHDLDRVLRWYRARGFPNARVVETRIEPEDASESDIVEADARCRGRRNRGCRARITLVIDEGDAIHVRSLDVETTDEVPADDELHSELVDELALELGGRFDEHDYEVGKQRMRALLAERGHCHASVEGHVALARAALTADVSYRVTAGTKCRVGPVSIEGHTGLPAGPIFRASDLEPGETFRPSDVIDAQQAVFALGAFASVEVVGNVDPASDFVPVVIRVAPARRNRFLTGAGVQAGVATIGQDAENQASQQWDVHVLGRWENRNLFGGMRRLAIEDRVRLVWNRQFPRTESFEPNHNLGNVVTMEFEQPAFIEARTSLLVTGLYDFGPDPYEGFVRHAIREGVDLSRSFFGRRLRVTGGLHSAAYRIPNEPVSPEDVRRDWTTTYWQQTIELDLRDRPVRTRYGAYFGFRIQEAGFGLPSDWDYVRISPEARAYAPIGAGIVLAARFRVGVMLVRDSIEGGISNTNPLRFGPDIHRFRGGGPVSNRGFLAQRLGDGDTGGTRSWEANLEVRVPMNENLWLALFGDMGDVSRDEHFRWNHLQLSLGAGIRYYTIVGPIRLDVGFRVPGAQVLGTDHRHLAFCADAETGATIDCNGATYRGRVFGGPAGAIHLTIGDSF